MLHRFQKYCYTLTVACCILSKTYSNYIGIRGEFDRFNRALTLQRLATKTFFRCTAVSLLLHVVMEPRPQHHQCQNTIQSIARKIVSLETLNLNGNQFMSGGGVFAS